MRKIMLALMMTGIIALPNLQSQTKIQLWPDLAPGTENRENTERWQDSTHVYEVYQPDLTVFSLEEKDTLYPAVIVCPGGGYSQLVIVKEGKKIARWLNRNGIVAFVLKYRLNPPEALQDAQRALSLIRYNASDYHIDPQKIGIIGFSAGAHLAGNLITHTQKTQLIDAIDSTSCKPDFWIGVYGGYGSNRSANNESILALVNSETPPAFLVHAGNDNKVPVQCSIDMYMALKENNVPAELHIYEAGKHGFALERNRGDAVTSTVNSWSQRCIDWLKLRDMSEK